MYVRFIFYLLLTLALSAPLLANATTPAYKSGAQDSVRKEASQRLAQIADRYFKESLDLDPLYASYVTGDERFLDRFVVTISPAELEKQKQSLLRTQRALSAINPQRLPATDQVTYAILQRKIKLQLAEFKFPSELLPIDHYGGMPTQFAQFASGQNIQPLRTVAHYDAFLRRLSQLPAWNAQAIVNLREGARRGVTQPRLLIERLLETLKPLMGSTLERHPYAQPVFNFPAGFEAADRDRLRAAYLAEIETRQLPSLLELARFLEQEYLPKARTSHGLNALPNGRAWYAQRLYDSTTTTLTADQIHQLGLKEVTRIRHEMETIQRHYGHQGSLSEFLRAHAKSPEFRPFKTAKDVLDAYAALNARIMPQLPQLFATLPKAELDIRAEPEVSRATASDHYTGPSLDGTRPGIFWAVIMNPEAYATTEMTALFLHEGQPGHHFHSARQQELQVPDFRKHDWITAYGEGWALYAETLGHEMGLFRDPDALLGQLKMELHRAIRLVVDTGLHAKGWTREKTIAYMLEVEGVSEVEAQKSTERYMAWPGQATGYKIGALKIRALRDEAQRRLGKRFSYADFHEQILGDGSLPLDLLEKKIGAWIKREAG